MNYLSDILNTLKWPLVVLIAAVIFFFIFKDRLTELEFDPNRRKMRLKFGERLNQARLQARKIEKTVAASGRQSTAERMAVFGTQRSREAVIEAWGALKQTIFSAAAAYNIRLTPSTSVQNVLTQMAAHGVFDHETAGLILLLDELGLDLMADSGLKPLERDARAYIALADVIIDWMMLVHISNQVPATPPDPAHETSLSHSATMVSSYFQPPAAGQPTANLIGIRGVVNGRSIPIEIAEFTIGSSKGNDLRIKGDDYVSGNHALIRFKNGSLFISDLDSKNGTFLNGKQVNQAVTTLQPGDHIRLGQAVLQLYQENQASGGRTPDIRQPTSSGTNPGPRKRTIIS